MELEYRKKNKQNKTKQKAFKCKGLKNKEGENFVSLSSI